MRAAHRATPAPSRPRCSIFGFAVKSTGRIRPTPAGTRPGRRHSPPLPSMTPSIRASAQIPATLGPSTFAPGAKIMGCSRRSTGNSDVGHRVVTTRVLVLVQPERGVDERLPHRGDGPHDRVGIAILSRSAGPETRHDPEFRAEDRVLRRRVSEVRQRRTSAQHAGVRHEGGHGEASLPQLIAHALADGQPVDDTPFGVKPDVAGSRTRQAWIEGRAIALGKIECGHLPLAPALDETRVDPPLLARVATCIRGNVDRVRPRRPPRSGRRAGSPSRR